MTVKDANFIAGEWSPAASGATYGKTNPYRPSEIVGTFPLSDGRDIDAAVSAATEAFPSWARLTGQQRGAILFRAAEIVSTRIDAIAMDMTKEMGKPLRESRIEVARGVDTLRFYAGEGWRPQGETFSQTATNNPIRVMYRPVGVVGLITPWNFPFSIPLWKSAPALAYGNSVVLKVAHEAPRTGLHLAACLEEAGLPPGVFNVVVGRGPDAGQPLVTHPDVRALSFTGSVSVGQRVRNEAVPLGKRVQLELGGHSPLVVMADSDLGRASDAAFAGAYWAAGQKCTATRRIYVQDDAYDEFESLFVARISSARVGDPSDPATEVGPVVSSSQLDMLLAAVDRGKSEGGTLLTGGARQGLDGYVLTPTLFDNVGDTSFLACEEVFGPVASIFRFSDLDEAIVRANGPEFGLSASIFTKDLGAAHQFASEIEAGIIRINAATAGGEPHVPFGGIKGSGYGPREQGRAARDFFTETVTVYENF
ncbi:MAG: aldehyde dehydrogenase family protein [Acidimicrobiales bacterium]